MSERFGVSVLSNEPDDRAYPSRFPAGLWSAAETNVVIRYDSVVLEQIRAEAVDKFMSIPRGGLEIGGVLFGAVEDTEVTIRAHRPLALEYQTGPSFVLSPTDENSLRALFATSSADPELKGLTAVGWYHSHTRSEIFLSDQDVILHDKFFPDRTQVALVVRPVKFQPTRAGFFVREPDGTIQSASSYKEFELEAGAPSEPATEYTPPVPAHEPQTRRELEPDTIGIAAPRPGTGQRQNRSILALLIALAAVAIIPVLVSRQSVVSTSSPRQAVPLWLSGIGENIVIEWDRGSKDILDAARGELEITDGRSNKFSIPLEHDLLQQGSVTYARLSESVEVRLRLFSFSNDKVTNDSVAHFVKPLPLAARNDEQLDTLPPAVTPSEPPIVVPDTKERTRVAEPVRRAVLPKPAAPRAPLAVMPGVDQAPQIAMQAPLPSLPQNTMPSPPPRIQAPQAQTRPARTLASGRAIWTGELRRGGVVMFDGGRASVGVLNGRLPTGPLRITAHPAELIDGGMVVYTQVGSAKLSEPPSAQNGWNLTVYRDDPRRVRELGIVELPSEANKWKFVLRSDAKTIGVIVLDWQEIPANH